MTTLFRRLGILRSALAVTAVALIVTAPFSGGAVQFEGWALWPTLVAPTLMVILAFVLPLDLMMTRVFMSDVDAGEHARLRFVLRVETVLFVVLLLAWFPFLLSLLET